LSEFFLKKEVEIQKQTYIKKEFVLYWYGRWHHDITEEEEKTHLDYARIFKTEIKLEFSIYSILISTSNVCELCQIRKREIEFRAWLVL
jgi:hypothetical protein